MAIDYSPARWAALKENYRKWWAHELDRPLIQITLDGRTPTRAAPPVPYYHFSSFYDLSVPASQIVDWWERNLESRVFTPDAFPQVWINFGPGVQAAFMRGGMLHNSIEAGTAWFHPRTLKPAAELQFEHDPDSPWWRRVRELTLAASERFGGLVQLGMTDLGGNLDILASFLPSEQLLLDLYDCPDEVKRLTWQAHDLWCFYFNQLQQTCGAAQPGYTAWAPIFSEEPYYMLQCDFCYMIGPAMFDEFVKPELAAMCRKLTHAFYHLDGPGQLPHLDSLLAIPELRGVQWVPGAGQPGITHWPEVYRKIHKAGKLIQIYADQDPAGLQALDIIADQIGTSKGIIMIGHQGRDKAAELDAFLTRHGVQ